MKMKGTIDHIKKWNGGYYFIQGDNGVRYWTHRKFTINADDRVLYNDEWLKMWDACAFVGARVEFEISNTATGDTPTAVNVTLAKEADPRLDEKILRRMTDKANRERHKANRKRNEQRQSQKKIIDDLTGYVIQQRIGEKWANVYVDDKLLWKKTVAEAKSTIEEMREYGDKYRLKRVQFVKNYNTGEMIPRP